MINSSIWESKWNTTIVCIIECQLTYEIGNEDKSLTCKLEDGKKNEFRSCYIGYRLMKNRVCKIIENSYTAIFKLKSRYTNIHILNREENKIELSDIEIYVNGTQITPFYHTERWWKNKYDYRYITYTFPGLGVYEVKILFKKPK